MAPTSGGDTTGLMYTDVGLNYAVTKTAEVGFLHQGAIFGIANTGLAGFGITYHFN